MGFKSLRGSQVIVPASFNGRTRAFEVLNGGSNPPAGAKSLRGRSSAVECCVANATASVRFRSPAPCFADVAQVGERIFRTDEVGTSIVSIGSTVCPGSSVIERSLGMGEAAGLNPALGSS